MHSLDQELLPYAIVVALIFISSLSILLSKMEVGVS